MLIYTVIRESADGEEHDLFTNRKLADEWADYIGGFVHVEYAVDRETVDLMKSVYGPSRKEDPCS